MLNKEAAYVAMSRAKQSSRLYFTESAFGDEERKRMYALMSHSSQQQVALDHTSEYSTGLPWMEPSLLDELEQNSDTHEQQQIEEEQHREGLADEIARER